MSLGVLHNPRPWPTTSNSGKKRVSFNRKKPCEGPGSHGGTVLLMVKVIVHDFQEVWFCLYSCSNSWTSSSTSPNLWTVRQKNVGCRGPRKKQNETHFPRTLSAGAPVSGVLCGCVVHLPLHFPLSICSFTPSLVPHSFHLDFIWFKHLNIISICCVSGSGPEWGRGPGLNHCATAAWAQLAQCIFSLIQSKSMQLCCYSYSENLNFGLLMFINTYFHYLLPYRRWTQAIQVKTQEMIHLQLYTAPHFTFFKSGGIGFNEARYKDLTGRHLNEEERKASPLEVHLP